MVGLELLRLAPFAQAAPGFKRVGIRKKEETRHPEDYSSFEIFWNAWPVGYKVARGYAEECWERAIKKGRIKVERGDLVTILKHIEASMESEQWQAGKIPHPSTWINQRRWEGDPPARAERRCLRSGHPAICEEDGCRYE